jgi:hypothetical protein
MHFSIPAEEGEARQMWLASGEVVPDLRGRFNVHVAARQSGDVVGSQPPK